LYTSSAGTLNAANGEPEQLQMNPTLIGVPVAWLGAEPAAAEVAGDELADDGLDVVELAEEDLLLEEHASRANTSATATTKANQTLRLGLNGSSPPQELT
jgi:hypothetical protein